MPELHGAYYPSQSSGLIGESGPGKLNLKTSSWSGSLFTRPSYLSQLSFSISSVINFSKFRKWCISSLFEVSIHGFNSGLNVHIDIIIAYSSIIAAFIVKI